MLHQRISKWSFLAVLVSFLGIMIISTHGQLFTMHFSSPLGVLLALGSAIFWAFYWIFNMKDKREAVTKLFLNFCFGFLYILITIMVIKGFSVPSWQGMAGSIYLGFFEMGIPFVLWLQALKFSSTTAKVTNLIYLSPFISLVIIHFTVGETILLSTFIGLIFIVGGIIFQQYLKS
jgi:drug/metabolite transporter (DMT)-like permease